MLESFWGHLGGGGIKSFRLGSPRRGEGCGERARTAAARNPRGPAAAAEANLDPPPPTARRANGGRRAGDHGGTPRARGWRGAGERGAAGGLDALSRET